MSTRGKDEHDAEKLDDITKGTMKQEITQKYHLEKG